VKNAATHLSAVRQDTGYVSGDEVDLALPYIREVDRIM